MEIIGYQVADMKGTADSGLVGLQVVSIKGAADTGIALDLEDVIKARCG